MLEHAREEREGGRFLLKYDAKHTAIVFTVIADHKHNLPLKDIVVHQSATYAGDIFV